jgi:hypothetical protein
MIAIAIVQTVATLGHGSDEAVSCQPIKMI